MYVYQRRQEKRSVVEILWTHGRWCLLNMQSVQFEERTFALFFLLSSFRTSFEMRIHSIATPLWHLFAWLFAIYDALLYSWVAILLWQWRVGSRWRRWRRGQANWCDKQHWKYTQNIYSKFMIPLIFNTRLKMKLGKSIWPFRLGVFHCEWWMASNAVYMATSFIAFTWRV